MRDRSEDWDGLAYIAPSNKYTYEGIIDVGAMFGQIFEKKLSSKPFAPNIKRLTSSFDFEDGGWSRF